MKRWSKAWQVAVEIIFVFPVILLLTAYIVEGTSLKAWLPWLPLYGWMGLLLASFKVPKIRIWRWLLAAVGSTLVTLVALGLTAAVAGHMTWQEHGKLLHLIFLTFIGTPLMLRGMLLYSKRWEEALPFGPVWLSLLVYIPACSIFPFIIKLAPYRMWLLVLGGIALFIGLLTANSLHLRTESRWGKREFALASSMLRQNRILVLGLLLTALALAAIKPIIEAVLWVLKMIVAAVVVVISWLNSLLSTTESERGGNETLPPQLPQGDGEPNMIARVLEIAAQIAVTVGLIALLLFILYRYIPIWGRVAWRGIQRLAAFLTRRFSSNDQSAGYTDETSSIFVWEDIRRSYEEKLKAWLPSKRKRSLRFEELDSNAERIRYLFRKYIQKRMDQGYEWQPHHTPSQMSGTGSIEQLTELYQKVRYGEQSLEDQASEVEKLKRSIENKS
jgi:hypothetical protein